MTVRSKAKRRTAPHPGADIAPTQEIMAKHEVAMIEPSRFTTDIPVPRIVGVHDLLSKSRRISDAQWTWADRYCREIEVLEGGRDGAALTAGASDRSEPIYDRGTAAAQFVRRAHDRMDADQRGLMMAACVMALSVVSVAEKVLGVARKEYGGDLGAKARESDAAFDKRVRERVYREVRRAIIAGSGIKDECEKEAAA
jgi:hypothetical protein